MWTVMATSEMLVSELAMKSMLCCVTRRRRSDTEAAMVTSCSPLHQQPHCLSTKCSTAPQPHLQLDRVPHHQPFASYQQEELRSADASGFGLHSMRRGAATNAANNGASDHVIQKQMRVATVETVRRYSSLNTVSLRSACSVVFQKI